MITRRTVLATGLLTLVPAVSAVPAHAAPDPAPWRRRTSANGWPISSGAIAGFRVAGSTASVRLRTGVSAAVLLHIARRWHYEIAPLGAEQGGTIRGHTGDRAVRAGFESNHLSGTAVALCPGAYPLGGSEKLWPHQTEIVRDILLDCEGTVAWGGDLTPSTVSHFHIAVRPGDETLARVAARLDTTTHMARPRTQTAGAVADPATPARRSRAKSLPLRR